MGPIFIGGRHYDGRTLRRNFTNPKLYGDVSNKPTGEDTIGIT